MSGFQRNGDDTQLGTDENQKGKTETEKNHEEGKSHKKRIFASLRILRRARVPFAAKPAGVADVTIMRFLLALTSRIFFTMLL
jgi:hypothetical protein